MLLSSDKRRSCRIAFFSILYSWQWPHKGLIFICLKALEKMKNDTTSVRMRGGDHLGYKKCRKKAPRSSELNFLTNCGFCRTKEEEQVYKSLPQFFKFLLQELVMVYLNLVLI